MIVTLCGSARFEDHFKTWNEALTMAGHTVFTLTRYPSEKGAKLWYTDAQKLALDEAHKRKINASEAVLVLNVFGYMGPSTLGEVEHAKARGKKLYALESWGRGNGIGDMHYDDVQEACRRAIPEGYVGSPIDTTSDSGFRFAYDLLDDVVTGERSYDLVKMVRACDERLKHAAGVPTHKVPSRDEIMAKAARWHDENTLGDEQCEHRQLELIAYVEGYSAALADGVRVDAPTDAQLQALWAEACQDTPAKPGWNRHLRFARAVLAYGVQAPLASSARCKHCGVAPGSVEQIGWICKDDLTRLAETGEAEVYEEQQDFKLLPGQEQFPVYVRKDAFDVDPSPAHSKSEYKRRVAQGDPNVVPPHGVTAAPPPPVAWEYENRYGNRFLTHNDPAKWHPHDREGFQNFRPLVYAPGVAIPQGSKQ